MGSYCTPFTFLPASSCTAATTEYLLTPRTCLDQLLLPHSPIINNSHHTNLILLQPMPTPPTIIKPQEYALPSFVTARLLIHTHCNAHTWRNRQGCWRKENLQPTPLVVNNLNPCIILIFIKHLHIQPHLIPIHATPHQHLPIPHQCNRMLHPTLDRAQSASSQTLHFTRTTTRPSTVPCLKPYADA